MTRGGLIAVLQEIRALAEESLRVAGKQPALRSSRKKLLRTKNQGPIQLDFDRPLRPFMKSYSKGLSGPKKFVLLVSCLAKGDLKKEVPLKEIEGHWNRMTSLLGMKFNRFFPAQAKDNNWVESKKKGLYNLRPGWRDSLRGKG
jgi:hypothetical protein